MRWHNDTLGDRVDIMTFDSTGNVGIGTRSPLGDIHIRQTSVSENGGNGLVLQDNGVNDHWRIYHSGSHCSFAESTDGGSTFTRRAYVASSTGNYVQPSDRRLKKNISELPPADTRPKHVCRVYLRSLRIKYCFVPVAKIVEHPFGLCDYT